MNKKILWTVIAVAIVILGAGVLAASLRNSSHQNSSASSNANMTTSAADSTEHATATNAVSMQNMAFSPTKITVKKGTTVTWTNNDNVEHTVTVDGGTGPKSDLFGNGQTYSYTFDIVGTFPYHCQVHTNMRGTVVVTE